jgi:DNA-binding NarL/FixJ family response regulator
VQEAGLPPGAGFHLKRGERIYSVLVIAEKEVIGACLAEVLREHGFDVTVAESFAVLSDAVKGRAQEAIDLVILTNTSIPPPRIRSIVPEIRARYPFARIVVLSGYCPDDFVADLMQRGIHGFLPLPYEQDALLAELDGLLSTPTP